MRSPRSPGLCLYRAHKGSLGDHTCGVAAWALRRTHMPTPPRTRTHYTRTHPLCDPMHSDARTHPIPQSPRFSTGACTSLLPSAPTFMLSSGLLTPMQLLFPRPPAFVLLAY